MTEAECSFLGRRLVHWNGFDCLRTARKGLSFRGLSSALESTSDTTLSGAGEFKCRRWLFFLGVRTAAGVSGPLAMVVSSTSLSSPADSSPGTMEGRTELIALARDEGAAEALREPPARSDSRPLTTGLPA